MDGHGRLAGDDAGAAGEDGGGEAARGAPGGAVREQGGHPVPAGACAEDGEGGARGGEAGVGGEEGVGCAAGVQDEEGAGEEGQLGELACVGEVVSVDCKSEEGTPYFEAQDAQARGRLAGGKWRMLRRRGRALGPGGEGGRRERRALRASMTEAAAATRMSWNKDGVSIVVSCVGRLRTADKVICLRIVVRTLDFVFLLARRWQRSDWGVGIASGAARIRRTRHSTGNESARRHLSTAT